MDRTLKKWKANSDCTEQGCWLWTGASYRGYGRVSIKGVKLLVHRAAYELAFGPVPDGTVIHHKCGNSLCFRPGHLQSISPLENNAEMYERRTLNKRISELEGLLNSCTCQQSPGAAPASADGSTHDVS